MKNIFKLLILTAVVLTYSSCEDDYLQTQPTASAGTPTIFETVENMELAINGVYKCMTQQYSYFGQGYNGEGTIKYYLGNYGGNNFNLSNTGNVYLVNNSYHINDNSTWILYPWYYYYRVIGNANAVIVYGPDAQGDEEMKNFIIAQAKVVRAYCYMMLSQRFHYRWSLGKSDEAKNGNGLILRLDTSTDGMPVSSANDTYAQIVKDLTEAIPVLEKEYYKRNQSSENFKVNKDVAYAVYARAALIKGDYSTALTYAQKAREDYALMNTDEYWSGFNTPNSEWIWSSYGAVSETLHYYSFFAYMAYDANTSTCRNYPRNMSKLLYEKIPETDIRRDMFLDPEDFSYSKSTGLATSGSDLYKKAFAKFTDLPATAKICAYQQFKFQCLDGVGVGHLNHFRASEMVLIEAECQYQLGNESAAQDLLEELLVSTGRDPQYSCTKTGEELFEEIKFYRGVELWGEGFEWFDLKRWNDPIDRKSFAEGGNSKSNYAVYSEQDESNNYWTSVLPRKETDYNTEVK